VVINSERKSDGEILEICTWDSYLTRTRMTVSGLLSDVGPLPARLPASPAVDDLKGFPIFLDRVRPVRHFGAILTAPKYHPSTLVLALSTATWTPFLSLGLVTYNRHYTAQNNPRREEKEWEFNKLTRIRLQDHNVFRRPITGVVVDALARLNKFRSGVFQCANTRYQSANRETVK
jgi:hypothetical protein